MNQAQEVFYATYSLLLKQGFVFDEAIVKQEVAGNVLTIAEGQVEDFIQIHFAEANLKDPVAGCSILFIQQEDELLDLLQANDRVYLKVLYGSAGIRIGDRKGNGLQYLYAGDEYEPGRKENYQVRCVDGPMVLARLELAVVGQKFYQVI